LCALIPMTSGTCASQAKAEDSAIDADGRTDKI